MNATGPRFRSARFLVLDPDDLLQSMLHAPLRAQGAARVTYAPDARAWLRAAASGEHDLLVADWDQPDLRGVEFVDRLRRVDALRDAALVLLADEVTPPMRALEELYDIGGFVQKPFTTQALLAALAAAWQRRQNPTEFALLLKRGWQLLEADAFDKALLVYNWLRQLDPASLAALYGAGEALTAQGQLADARAIFEEVVERSPLCAKAYGKLSDVARAQDDPEAVFRVLQRLVELTPNTPDTWVRLARQHFHAGEVTSAERAVQRALRLNPALWEATLVLTELLLAQDRLPEATELADAARRHHPGQTDLFNNLGIAFRKRGQLDQASRAYETALSIQPDNPVLLYNAAVVDFLLEADGQARARLARALTLRADFASARRLGALLASKPPLDRAARAALFA